MLPLEENILYYSVLVLIVSPATLFCIEKSKIKSLFKRRIELKEKDSYEQPYNVYVAISYVFLVCLNLTLWFHLLMSWSEYLSLPGAFNYYTSLKFENYSLKISPVPSDMSSEHFSDYKMISYSLLEKVDDKVPFSSDAETCDISSVKVAKPNIITKPDELKKIRNMLKKMAETNSYGPAKSCFQDSPKESEAEIMKKWFKFHGSSVWLDHYGVHYMVSRVVYSKDKTISTAFISLLYAQVFDKNWNELESFTFPNSDFVYPNILPIDVTTDEGIDFYQGVEDPKITIRTFFNKSTRKHDQEPVVVCNGIAFDNKFKRAIHLYFPFSDNKTSMALSIEGNRDRSSEKNWVPFYDGNDKYINFIYTLAPLRIVECEISSAICKEISGGKYDMKEDFTNGEIRGATNLVRIPPVLIPEKISKLRKYWVGIGRSRSSCKNVQEISRPHLFLLSRASNGKGDFTVDYISTIIDWNIKPKLWDRGSHFVGCRKGEEKCSHLSSLFDPTAIDSFDFDKDLLTMTYTLSSESTGMIFVKGILAHIQKILGGDPRTISNHYRRNSTILRNESQLLTQFAIARKNEYCNGVKSSSEQVVSLFTPKITSKTKY
ncbi:hypothetical protein G9P44_000468 [Scheffersomyces stipitis]|nr:hypothetical protein G9P44_000468 [Scheffersomyces stipitis]